MAWKDFDGAKKVYQSLLEHHPTHATARKNLDFLLEQTRGFPGFGPGERAIPSVETTTQARISARGRGARARRPPPPPFPFPASSRSRL